MADADREAERGSFVPEVDLSRPSDARTYDLFLGGKNNFEIDRQLHQEILKIAPETPALARENRRWLAEVIDRTVHEGGIDQFLDLGAGLPTSENTHELVFKADPRAVVVYVDKDPTVIAHGQALLADDTRSHFAGGDLADPAAVLAHPVVRNALELDRPIGLILALALHQLPDTDEVRDIVAAYVAALPSGSYLAISHPSNPRDGSRLAGFATAVEDKFRDAFPAMTFRTPDEIAALFEDVELLEPGLVGLGDWWPEDERQVSPAGVGRLVLAGLARKP
ncbi:MAG TPA: SAM-dependent methyltransferase [Kribbella sp.]